MFLVSMVFFVFAVKAGGAEIAAESEPEKVRTCAEQDDAA